ncbi:MAG: single-stranded DNA-binding protein, partial [Deltaproteobacteria bacterium]|nr:single-stranded DNA-binding protein [Deltaproteobacteria bacterium]
EFCRDWLDISGPVKQPKSSHPKRPVQGFACTRREVSGRRLWGWAKKRFGKPDAFFRRIFVFNYCPLAFLEDSGRNRTPDKLPAAEKEALFAACDEALAQTMDWLKPKQVVGIGAFAEKRAREALDSASFPIGRILHPSPASPAANRGWAEQAEAQLLALGVSLEPRP